MIHLQAQTNIFLLQTPKRTDAKYWLKLTIIYLRIILYTLHAAFCILTAHNLDTSTDQLKQVESVK